MINRDQVTGSSLDDNRGMHVISIKYSICFRSHVVSPELQRSVDQRVIGISIFVSLAGFPIDVTSQV